MSNLRKEYSLREKIKVWFNPKLIVVFTVGKVGTLTICNSIRQSGFSHVHPHSLYYTWPGIYFLKTDKSYGQKLYYLIRTLFKRLKVSIWRRLVPEIKIISGVRDPFSRSISAYFEQAHYNGGIPKGWSFDEIKKDFEKRADFFALDRWFENEFIRFTGIDIYGSYFDRSKRYLELECGKTSAFVYRLDVLEGISSALSKFCGDKVDVLTTNKSSVNDFGKRYLDFKSKYRYPVFLADEMMKSRAFNFFYSDCERKKIYQNMVDIQLT